MGHVIKASGRVIPGAVFDAHAEARAARDAARAALAAAEADAATIRADAHRRGLAQGLAEGHDRAVAEAVALLAEARAHAARTLTAAVPVAAALAAKMAERIVGRAVALAPQTMAEIVTTALAASRPRDAGVTIRVHPEDLAAVSVRREALATGAPAATELALVADESVGRHGCVIETALGRIDARLETQLAALEQAILRGQEDEVPPEDA